MSCLSVLGRRLRGRLLLSALVLAVLPTVALAQGVTTGNMQGLVTDSAQQPVAGATVTAIHTPSGTGYEARTGADGRFQILSMRVGGPYSVTVFHGGNTTASPFEPQTKEGVTVNLGVATDLSFTVSTVTVKEEVTVTAQSDPIFSSGRTGAATAVARDQLATLPTITGRLESVVRLTPQSGGGLSFAGQDTRYNNITVDGSSFNNSFGLGASPGERTGVAPIALAAIEQVQVSVAPYDVRQGSFVGAGVNTVTRSGGNRFSGSFYHSFRDESLVGTEAKGLAFNPGTFNYRNTGGWGSGPVVKNKLFFFGSYENEIFKQPGTTFLANSGGQTVGGSVTRVLASDLNQLSSFLEDRYGYETGPYEGYEHETPAKRYLAKADYNLNPRNRINVRYTQLDSITDVLSSNSNSLGFGNRRSSTLALNYQNSNYQILENIRSVIGEWNSVFGTTLTNNLIVGFTKQDESRASRGTIFPLVDILDAGTTYLSFGFEAFTPNNELRYDTFQIQNNLTKLAGAHTLTFGVTAEKYRSENVFFPGSQSVYVYNSLADFYADANRTAPVNLRRFQVRYMNIPDLDKPLQPLEVFYTGAYAQDNWRLSDDFTLTAGVRFDVPFFGDTGFRNELADALTFRDENGQPVQYRTDKLPDPNILWSPRVGFNWDLGGARTTQVRGGTGVFTGRPPYVWISNQIGNTGVLTGFEQLDNTTARPFSPDPATYKPTSVTGAPAASYELALTEEDYKFPQTWRSNVAVDQRLPFGLTSTAEFIYNRDVNGVYYINANLPAAQTSFNDADGRPRWTNNRLVSNIQNAMVMKNQDIGRSWNVVGSVERPQRNGLWAKAAYSYTESKNTIDPGSIAAGTWFGNQHPGDPNNPGLGFSQFSPGHRFFVAASYTKEYFRFGGTTVAMFLENRTLGNTSYTYSGDYNNDGGTGNDLLYVPRDVSEMNFQTFTQSGRTFTAAEQAAAWDSYIAQDAYLSTRRGQYAERNAVFLPRFTQMDVSVSQDFFATFAGRRHAFQFRVDVLNFGNLLNSDWGVGQRLISNQPIVVPSAAQGGVVDAQGRGQYRLRVVNNELMTRSLETTALERDVYRVQFSLRYTF